jgi:hypothetical protein
MVCRPINKLIIKCPVCFAKISLNRKPLIKLAGVAALAVVGIVLYRAWERRYIGYSLEHVVSELGPPDYLALKAEFVKENGIRVLRLDVSPKAPQAIVNWNSHVALIAVWLNSADGKEKARLFYNQVLNDKSFDGLGIHLPFSRLGEWVTLMTLDERNRVIDCETIRVEFMAMRTADFLKTHHKKTQQQ